jgi:hypothetical protein
MKVVFKTDGDGDDRYTPLVLTPNKVYDVIKIVNKIFYQIKADDGESRTYYKGFFIDVSVLRENKINEIIFGI